jgi:ABC transporter substrate binding protein (PQQ-dependent alcohol dehydrogenase system)
MSEGPMRGAILRAGLLAVCALVWSGAAGAEDFVFAYVGLEGDPHYRAERSYTGLTLKQPYPPLSGAKMALRESRIIGRSLGIEFELIERAVPIGEDAAAVVEALSKESGAQVFLLDLPAEMLRATAGKLAGAPLVLFNVRNEDDDLRNENCAPNLYHAVPSYRMLSDALVQYLFKKGWKKVLVLRGPDDADQSYAESFLASARRMRLEIVDDRRFELTNDPRKREQSNVALITGGLDYDVIFIADGRGEFSRYVPYQTYLPRPLVGDEGMTPTAWHWTWERHGAPQLNQRFARIEKARPMRGEDWAAWVSIKSVITAIRKTGATDLGGLRRFLTDPDTAIDAYKGNPVSFRAWNNQLRQPILLHTHNAVVARAPVEGFLHRLNYLDTLGYDREESKCALAK